MGVSLIQGKSSDVVAEATVVLPAGLLRLLCGQGIGVVAGMAFMASIARLLPASEFATVALVQVWLGYGVVIAEFGTSHVGSRMVASATSEADRIVPSVLVVRAVATLAAVMALLIWGLATRWVPEREGVLVMVALLLLSQALNAEWWHVGHCRERVIVRGRVVRQMIVISGIAWMFIAPSAEVAVAILLAAAIGHAWAVWPREWRRGSGWMLGGAGRVFAEAWPLVVSMFATQWVWSGVLVLTLQRMNELEAGAALLGQRALAAATVLVGAYATYLLPRSAALSGDASAFAGWLGHAARRAWLGTLGFLALAPLAYMAVPLIFGSKYPEAPLCVALYMGALPALLWRVTLSNSLFALGASKEYLVCALAGVVASLLVFRFMPLRDLYKPLTATFAGEAVFALTAAGAARAWVRRAYDNV